MAILGHWNVVAECRGVVPLSLVQDLVLLGHSGYEQLLAVIGGRPYTACVTRETNPEGVNVALAAAVDRVNDFLSDALKIWIDQVLR